MSSTSEARPKSLCACGCGRKFTPVRYTHRYATAECYQLHYRKEHPIIGRIPEEGRIIRVHTVPEIPKSWMTLAQAGEIFAIVPNVIRARLRKIIRKREGVEGFNTFELIQYFLDHAKKYGNVVKRLHRYNLVRNCARCSREVPGLEAGDYVTTCGRCLVSMPSFVELIKTEEKPMPPVQESPTGLQVLDPLSAMLTAILDRLCALEATCAELRNASVPPPPSVDAAQLSAEIAYLKEAIRKAHNAVEDQGIRSSAVESRLVRLEQDLGVTA